MSDEYSNYAKSVSDPATMHFAITPNDSADLVIRPRAIYVKTSGDVAMRDETGTNITYPVTAGLVLPFRPVRVLATGTTATVIGWM